MGKSKRETYEVAEYDIKKNVGDVEKNKTKFIFAIRLNKLLKDKEISQEELSDKTEIMMSSISTYRAGKAEPKITIAKKIASYLNVSVDYLIGLTDVETPEIDKRATCDFLGLSENAINNMVNMKNNLDNTLEHIIMNYLFDYNYISNLISVMKSDLEDHIFELDINKNNDDDWAFSMALRDENEKRKFAFSSEFIKGIYENRNIILENTGSTLRNRIVLEMNKFKLRTIKEGRKMIRNEKIIKCLKEKNVR